ncbi:MAG: hypothetical protein FWC92_04765 [Defluviitaleaceae bacterium]|nr:hypothetical protein [Defluviitaleaceae bacterium]
MRKFIMHVMATTGLAVVVLSAFIRPFGFDLDFSRTVLLAFAANIVIHLGLLLTQKLEVKYLALEVFIDIAYTAAVLLVFGLVFDWFGATPLIIMVATATAIHLIALFSNIAHIKVETSEINKLLKRREAKQKFAITSRDASSTQYRVKEHSNELQKT